MNKVHYGTPDWRPACGAWVGNRPHAKTADRSKVTCLLCRSTHKFTTRWHDKG